MFFFSFSERMQDNLAHPKCQEFIYHTTYSEKNCTVWGKWLKFWKTNWSLPVGMSGAVSWESCEAIKMPDLGALRLLPPTAFQGWISLLLLFPPLTHSPQRSWNLLLSGRAPNWQVRAGKESSPPPPPAHPSLLGLWPRAAATPRMQREAKMHPNQDQLGWQQNTWAMSVSEPSLLWPCDLGQAT